VSRNYIFTGSVPYEQVSMYINACEVCVVPKRPLKSGYSPLKLYEYMACGKPVIASRLDVFEVLEQINSGLLVNPEDPNEFSTAVLQLLSDPYLREKMGFNGRNYVQRSQS
jgi:glycosyltransferase involved in cell wall biosynthesis